MRRAGSSSIRAASLSLAQYIAKRHGALFDLLVLDEGHEYGNQDSRRASPRTG